MTLRGGGSRLSVIMTLTVGNMICESPLTSSNIGNCELYFLNFFVLIVKKNLQFKGPFLNIDSHCVMHCVTHRCSAYMGVGVAMTFCQLSFFYSVLSKI